MYLEKKNLQTDVFLPWVFINNSCYYTTKSFIKMDKYNKLLESKNVRKQE